MGVRVITSNWNSEMKKDVERVHNYNNAHTWNLQQYGQCTYLEVVGVDDEDDDRVVAVFSEFDRVEVIDSTDEDDEV